MDSEQPHWKQYEPLLERYQNYRKEAEVFRLLRQQSHHQPVVIPFIYRVLEQMGRVLVEWGAWLQERFSPCGRLDPTGNNGGC